MCDFLNSKKMTAKILSKEYETVVKIVDDDAANSSDRAYGGVVRSVKGKLQEYITENLVKIAWADLGGSENRLSINSEKIKIPVKLEYVQKIQDEEICRHILQNIDEYYYGLSVDKHIFIDGEFVMGIECKAYAENAMLKRILVDFHLLKSRFPKISCHLFQLESQLGGDYSDISKKPFGSKPTHSIMSYFPDVDLHITTLLSGERKVEKPIHKFFKPLKVETLNATVKFLQGFLKEYL